jgi:hypothetical protein
VPPHADDDPPAGIGTGDGTELHEGFGVHGGRVRHRTGRAEASDPGR